MLSLTTNYKKRIKVKITFQIKASVMLKFVEKHKKVSDETVDKVQTSQEYT